MYLDRIADILKETAVWEKEVYIQKLQREIQEQQDMQDQVFSQIEKVENEYGDIVEQNQVLKGQIKQFQA